MTNLFNSLSVFNLRLIMQEDYVCRDDEKEGFKTNGE